jgi:hypothetical protein
MPVYELWRSKDGTETSLFGADYDEISRQLLTIDVDGGHMELIAEFWAPNWRAAVEAHKSIMWPEVLII